MNNLDKDPLKKETRIAVVGLGYVGFPLAAAFDQAGFSVIGYDHDPTRIQELEKGKDRTGEYPPEILKQLQIRFTTDPSLLKQANFIIVTVPTPVDQANRPDLTLLRKASQTIGKNLSENTIVVFESTVYPGVTEEICVPILEEASGFKSGAQFKVGYSPERINPGDREHTLDKVIKVVSGMDPESLEKIVETYGAICKAGVWKTPDIKTAEAAKVIENIQRDLNIALMNELAVLFNKVN
jgi:UDP-N-acetyl-D-galactosamine dehydrogenase